MSDHEPDPPCCDFRDHDGSVTCPCTEHHQDEQHPFGTLTGAFGQISDPALLMGVGEDQARPVVGGHGLTATSNVVSGVPRYTTEVWELVQSVMHDFPNDQLLRGDVIFSVLPTPSGLQPMTMIYVEGAGLVLGTTMGLCSNPLQPPLLLRRETVAEIVQMLVQGIRETRAEIAVQVQGQQAETNGGTIDLSQFRR